MSREMTDSERALVQEILDTLDKMNQRVQVMDKGFDRIENKIEWMVEELKRDRNDYRT